MLFILHQTRAKYKLLAINVQQLELYTYIGNVNIRPISEDKRNEITASTELPPPTRVYKLIGQHLGSREEDTVVFGSKGVCALGKAPPNTDKKGSCYCPLWKRNGFFYCFYMFPFAFLGKLYYSLSLAVTCLIEKKTEKRRGTGEGQHSCDKKTCEDERKGCYMNAVE